MENKSQINDVRAAELFNEDLLTLHKRTDHLFAALMTIQWIAGILVSIWISPRTWEGVDSSIHLHVWSAFVLGGIITALPVALAFTKSGHIATRQSIAIGQALMSTLLIHLTGGRLETHFHVFGSLAILAFYRDWRVLITASLIICTDHLVRTLYWPQSIYGVAVASPWRAFEHAMWVVFEVTFLVIAIKQSIKEMHDISLRESTMETQGEQFRLITENAVDLISLINIDGSRSYDSPSFSQVLGYTSAELSGTYLVDGIHPEDRTKFKDVFKNIIQTGQGQAVEYRTKHKNNSWVYLESHGAAIRNSSGEVEKVVMVGRDITERKNAEYQRQLMEVKLRQAQKLESIGQLAAGIAHEINTPTQFIGDNTRFLQSAFSDLKPLRANYEQLLKAAKNKQITPKLINTAESAMIAADVDYLSVEIPKAISQSLEGVDRVARIVSAMKDFSHPAAEQKVPVDLNRCIESTITVARNEWKYVAEIVTDLDRKLPPVPCIPGEINQVILNLIVNAAHAIEDVIKDRTNEKGTITISTHALVGCVELRITDTGTGIPENVQERIFDPFFTTKTVRKGTGQGLAISRSVVIERHGGSLTFKTKKGIGTTFTISLPLLSQ